MTVEHFQELYRADTFYAGFGLDNPLMYAAHKAAGGMTSVYRQIGIGSERLFRAVLTDELGLSANDVIWSYDVAAPGGKTRTLSLDARIPVDAIADPVKRGRVREWVNTAAAQIGVDGTTLEGVVFEVRQGYKSKDSKRQNADIANGAKAYEINHLPCAAIMSGQIDIDIVTRYRANEWCMITGAGAEDERAEERQSVCGPPPLDVEQRWRWSLATISPLDPSNCALADGSSGAGADPSSMRLPSEYAATFALPSHTRNGLMSTIAASKPWLAAHRPVVPVPENGSSTRDPVRSAPRTSSTTFTE